MIDMPMMPMITKAYLELIACELKHYLFISKCRLLITFANSLDPDQARQNVRPDLDPNYLSL